jgi:hypothetical protein
LYKHILIDVKLKTGKSGPNTAAWKRSIKEANVRIGLQRNLRKKKRKKKKKKKKKKRKMKKHVTILYS